MALNLTYPPAADNNFKKYYICYRLQEKLRLIHNNWGAKFRNGEITEAEWHEFLDTWFEPRSKLVIEEILRIRQLAKNHNWNINLNNIFIEG